MPGLVIRNLPDELHRKLKERAALHHRSMTKEAVALLEESLTPPPSNEAFREPPEPLKVGFRPDDEWLYHAIREGRE